MKAANPKRIIEGGLVRQLSDPYKGVYYSPLGVYMERDGLHLVIDPEAPHWLSTNEVGAQILRLCDGRRTITEVAEEIARRWDLPLDEAIADTFDFLSDAAQVEFVSRKPNLKPPYPGRATTVAPSRLSELYVFVTNDCNLRCTHCYVSSGDFVPEDEMTADDLYRLIDEARDLGVQRFYFTGGEPFMRRDIFDLIEYVCSESELVILTNATFFNKSKLARLTEVARAINGDPSDNFDQPRRLNLQISVDGPDAELHEMVRGPRTFKRTIQGIRDLVTIGLTPVVSTVITTHNMDRMAETTRMLGELGVKEHHILWLQERGRAHDNNDLLIPPSKVTQIMRELREVAADVGIVIDNETSLRVRVRGKAMRKTDLCNCGYESLDVFSDGQVYPCVWFSGAPSLACGSVRERSLRDIWLNSPILQEIRANSVQHREGCNECHLKFICGGGTNCSSYFDSLATRGKGSFQAAEPYCEAFMDLTHDLLWEQASHGVKTAPHGYSPPVVYNAMERQGAACAQPNMAVVDSAFDVGSFHCACVLQADVADGMKVRSAARIAAMQAGDLSLIPSSISAPAAGAPSKGMDLLSASMIRSTGGRARPPNLAGTLTSSSNGHSTNGGHPATWAQGTVDGPPAENGYQENAVLDGMGLASTRLLLLLAPQVRALPPGDMIKVVNDDPAAREDVGTWCRMTGNELEAVVKGKGYANYYIRKSGLR